MDKGRKIALQSISTTLNKNGARFYLTDWKFRVLSPLSLGKILNTRRRRQNEMKEWLCGHGTVDEVVLYSPPLDYACVVQ